MNLSWRDVRCQMVKLLTKDQRRHKGTRSIKILCFKHFQCQKFSVCPTPKGNINILPFTFKLSKCLVDPRNKFDTVGHLSGSGSFHWDTWSCLCRGRAHAVKSISAFSKVFTRSWNCHELSALCAKVCVSWQALVSSSLPHFLHKVPALSPFVVFALAFRRRYMYCHTQWPVTNKSHERKRFHSNFVVGVLQISFWMQERSTSGLHNDNEAVHTASISFALPLTSAAIGHKLLQISIVHNQKHKPRVALTNVKLSNPAITVCCVWSCKFCQRKTGLVLCEDFLACFCLVCFHQIFEQRLWQCDPTRNTETRSIEQGCA